MSDSNRTALSLKNARVSIIFMVVNMLLQFFVRRVFLEHLGTDILGLNTTAQNLLQFLNLAELGIGAAIGFSLYKPIFEKDEKTICEIVSLQRNLYRTIAYIVIAGATIMGAFFPLIFKKMPLPLWYAYASFGVLLFSALLSYFVNYTQVLLSADQKEYKIMTSFRLWMIVRLLVQIVAVKYLPHPYIWWLVLEGFFAAIASWSLHRTVRRTYPFLRRSELTGKELRKKYPQITLKIKQVFFHKISQYVLQQTSPLVIYALATLTLVTLYGNYNYIIVATSLLINALFTGVNPGIGNLIAEGNRERIVRVFGEVFSFRFLTSLGMSVLIFYLSQDFVSLWVGSEYLLPESTLFIIAITFFLNYSGIAAETFVIGYGMFQDIWVPVVEAVLNLGLSIWFGIMWGLDGILLGVFASRVMTLFFWKPWFLYSKGFGISIMNYVRLYLRHVIAAAIGITAIIFIFNKLTIPIAEGGLTSWLMLAVKAIAYAAITFVALYLPMAALTPEARQLARRALRKKFG